MTPGPLARAAARLVPRIEAALEAALASAAPAPRALGDAMRYSVFSGGKRFRPLLVLLSCEAGGGRAASALPAAVAVEFVHTYSLIHDDLPAMDDDDVRRGRPTLHRVAGEATAILAGDALLTLAFERLSRVPGDAALARALVATLARAAGTGGMVGGQVDDMRAEGKRATARLVRSIHLRKTASLVSASAAMGALSADAPRAVARKLARYGERVGLAFQIADDLLDVEGAEKDLGKRARKDRERRKATYPAAVGVRRARAEAERLAALAARGVRGLPRERELADLARFVVERRG